MLVVVGCCHLLFDVCWLSCFDVLCGLSRLLVVDCVLLPVVCRVSFIVC